MSTPAGRPVYLSDMMHTLQTDPAGKSVPGQGGYQCVPVVVRIYYPDGSYRTVQADGWHLLGGTNGKPGSLTVDIRVPPELVGPDHVVTDPDPDPAEPPKFDGTFDYPPEIPKVARFTDLRPKDAKVPGSSDPT